MAGPATAGGTAVAGRAVAVAAPSSPKGRRRRSRTWVTLAFLIPALVLLGALMIYPIFFSIWRSLYDRLGDNFVGLDNYSRMFTSQGTLIAVRNTALWVVLVPALVTALGLVFAVLTERVSFGRAFKVAVFMPMAISFLSAGVIWRVVYEREPERGLANAAIQGTADLFRSPGPYPGARPSDEAALVPDAGGFATAGTVAPGESVALGLIAISPELIPEDAVVASTPQAGPADGIAGVVWLDFTRGGGGTAGVVDPTEQGLPRATVEAVSDGQVAATATTGPDGSFVLGGLGAGDYTVRIAQDTFREPFGGLNWLAPPLITPAIMVAYIWIWAGFAMVIIAAGLAAIPREVLEASRVDGATEWQVFRRVTAPLLAPVLAVVLVTLVINVLKIFDIVFVISPGSALRDANVIAVEMWNASFGARDFGLGSALAVFLLLLVIPAMAFNVRRFRREL
jgi:alpha-glucoside transport system permease protein